MSSETLTVDAEYLRGLIEDALNAEKEVARLRAALREMVEAFESRDAFDEKLGHEEEALDAARRALAGEADVRS